MSAPLLMVLATFLFASMSVCVKLASLQYGTGEIVLYRGVVGALFVLGIARARGVGLRTTVPAMHAWRSVVGVSALCLWFYSIGGLPLATAVTLNYMSSVWMALFLIGGAVMLKAGRIDGRLIATVMAGFAGVALVLRPTLNHEQLWHGMAGLLSGMFAALAYLQVTTLGRAGEPEERIVFYFSLGGMTVGALLTWAGGTHPHSASGLALLLAIGVLATSAQMLMTRAYTIGRTLTNASLQYMAIVFSFIYGVTLFDDPVTWTALAGMVLIVVAGLLASLLRSRQAPAELVLPTPSEP